MKNLLPYLMLILCFPFLSISYSQEATEIMPQSSTISLDGYVGCVAPFKYTLEIAQDQKRVHLSHRNDAIPDMGEVIQKTIPYDKFREFWSSIIALNPMALNEKYEGIETTADFRGTLKFEYKVNEETFEKKIEIEGTAFENDKRMKKLYGLINDFLHKNL